MGTVLVIVTITRTVPMIFIYVLLYTDSQVP